MPDNGAQPVTRAELHAELSVLKTEWRAELRALEERLTKSLTEGLTESLTEKIRDSQTEILRAFHSWASPLEQRMRGTQTFVMGFEERLTQLEERVGKIERGGR